MSSSALETLAPAKGGGGGWWDWNRQLWRHQRRSHFPANPDGPVRGLTPETPCCKREGGEGRGMELIFLGPRVPLDGIQAAAARSKQLDAAKRKTASLQTNRHAPTCVRHASIFASLLHHIRNLSTANGRSSVQARGVARDSFASHCRRSTDLFKRTWPPRPKAKAKKT